MQKVYTAKDIERIQQIAQDIISLDAPMKNEEGEDASLGAIITDTAPSPMELAIEKEKRDILYKAFEECLGPREILIMSIRYGFYDGSDTTLAEIGEKYGITRERVRQIEMKALRKLRTYFAKKGMTGDMI
jgi:RNA polymerase primary sigma factor